MNIPTNPSESFRKRNPQLYGGAGSPVAEVFTEKYIGKRIRQSTKPLLNKLEQEWFDICCTAHVQLIAQGITFRLANGLRYTPDIFTFEPRPTAFEVKGNWFTDDANAKLKMFASAYPSIFVILAWKENGVWLTQRVLP